MSKKKPLPFGNGFSLKRSLAMSYSHMGRPHTTIGAERFHFRVRNGIGWFPLAIAARQFGLRIKGTVTLIKRFTALTKFPLELRSLSP